MFGWLKNLFSGNRIQQQPVTTDIKAVPVSFSAKQVNSIIHSFNTITEQSMNNAAEREAELKHELNCAKLLLCKYQRLLLNNDIYMEDYDDKAALIQRTRRMINRCRKTLK